MIMADYSDDGDGGVILEGPFDPDAQATVTDYIDYTEYLPADLIRSLTLIRGLDERYLEAAQRVHDFTKTWGQLPDLPSDVRPDPYALRKDISAELDRAINARESAYAEACRLYDVVDRHFNRLDCIKQKLQGLPKPISREPTPPSTQTLPNKRGRPRKGEAGAPPATRITLRLDGQDNAGIELAQRSRGRRSLIAAEHLAGLHPDSPIDSTEHSDVEADSKVEASEEPGAGKGKKDKYNRRPRTSGLASNAHGGVAGISTSNALAMLNPPPEDAKPGSEDMPWLRLTEWEMTKLRKKMKKNAVWQPSEVMIHRELALRGRGWEAYRAAKAEAEANGTEFIDCDDIMNTYIPGLLTRRSEATKDTEGTMVTKLSNRGMKLNEAKKLKRENMAREQAAAAAAAAAAEGESTTKHPAEIVSTSTSAPPNAMQEALGKSSRLLKKRKFEEETTVETPAVPPADDATRGTLRSSTKRRKDSKESLDESVIESRISTASTEKTTKSPPAPSAEPSEARPQSAASSVAFAATVTSITKEGKTSTPPVTRPPSRRLSAAVGAEPATTLSVAVAGKDLRQRKSATPARKTPVPEGSRAASVTAPGRRKKRPAPGPVSSGQDGGAAVSYGRRKAKPTKKRILARDQDQKDGSLVSRDDIRIDEDGVLEEIDPSEPRYCLCGDISFGTMICCENQDCDKEWFHLDCVGLSEVPSRTAKWYCPDCRVKFNKAPDGIVKIGPSRR